jgi:hypothetical protein
VLSKDFEAGTDVVKRKIKQVRALNHVVKTMRGKIQDLDLDPVELKVDRDQWRHEAKALKLQVAKLKEDRDHWEHQANFFRLERDELKVRLEELENNKPNNADEGYDDDVVMDDQEVDAVEGNGQVEEVGEDQGVGIEGHGVVIEGNGVGIEGSGVFIEENVIVQGSDVLYQVQVSHGPPQAEGGQDVQVCHTLPQGGQVAFDEF